ncbi:hypothetical protein FNF28_01155 [Cafeteria roenbergensis]|uniref:EF-hand domain-containing protein n=1 Tax=Cafeteria roenbergensis TaxID=33653 RepID=A0A5A8DZE1_CAFRO|nr:hypothetical protein FNF28_01155 [Cafeteria roenbergensis]
MAAPKVLQPKRKPGDSDAGLSRAPAYRATQGRMGEAMARRAKGGGDGGGDGGSTAGGSSTTAGGGASSASRTAAQLTHIGSEEDGPSTVVVKTAAAAEDLVRAEAQLSSKLREAIRGGSSATKGRRAGQAASSKGTDQVARSLAKRRQARLEMARLRSQSAFVDWLWLGNTDRPDKVAEVAAFPAGSRTGATAPVAAVRPGSEASEGLDGRGSDAKLAASSTPIELAEAGDGASGPGGSPAQAWGSDAGDPAAGVLSTRSGNSGGAGSAQGRLDSGGADGKPADGATAGTERSVAPKQWTGAGKADGRVGRVKGGGGRNRRGSLGASAVDQILSDFDKHRAETGAEGGRKKRGARGVRGGGRHKAMGSGSAGDSKKAGDSTAAAPASSSKPQNEQAPEKGNVHARIAAKRRHLPDGGCARCWAISTRCCAEAWELRQARAAAAREGVVLTGRAQEAVEVLGITQSQIRTLHRHFVEMDDGLEGRIHLNDFFEEFLEMERSAVTDAIWLALVENTTGQMLGFEDFVLIVCVYCMFTEADILRFCFSTFDINGNGDLDEAEFVQMLRIVNHKKPLFPGSFKQALRDFDTDSNGVITFDEFVEMNAKFPQLLWPLFQLQDRMQMRSLGRAAWTKISRRDAEMRQANQTSLRSKELAVKHSRGLALDGWTSLMWAASEGANEVVGLLLDYGADLEARDDEACTALVLATTNGRNETVKNLLARGADLEAKDAFGSTALMWAAEMGHSELVDTLLDSGAELEARNRFGCTALIWAVEQGHADVAVLLMERGANPDVTDKDGRNAASLCADDACKAAVQRAEPIQRWHRRRLLATWRH